MEAKELRIGNYVQQVDELFKVSITTLEELMNHNDVYKPIPLTEEWLVKFGFADIQGYLVLTDNPLSDEDPFMILYKDGQMRLFGNKIKCDYVHQLQNLYFDLSSEELKINEP